MKFPQFLSLCLLAFAYQTNGINGLVKNNVTELDSANTTDDCADSENVGDEECGFCKWELNEGLGRCIKTEIGIFDFYEANKRCIDYGGEMVTIKDKKENDIIGEIGNFYNLGRFWIGLIKEVKEPNFAWTNDAILEYKNFNGKNLSELYDKNENLCVKQDSYFEWNVELCEYFPKYDEDNLYHHASIICQKRATDNKAPAPTGPTCQKGWRSRPNSGFCYKPTRLDCYHWQTCEDDCLKDKSHLASIHSLEENNFVGQMAIETGKKGAWLGGRKTPDSSGGHENTKRYEGGKWIDGEPIIYNWSDNTPMDYEMWFRQDPNNLHGEQRCMEILELAGGGYRWNDMGCDKREFGGICKIPEEMSPSPAPAPEKERVCPEHWKERDDTKICYRTSKTKADYNKTKGFCETKNGTLVSIGSHKENDFVKEVIQGAEPPVWIDHTDQYTNFKGDGADESVGECTLMTEEGTWISQPCKSPGTGSGKFRGVCVMHMG